MLILQSTTLLIDNTDAPVSPLNAVWFGFIEQTMVLPQLGHLFLVCPLEETQIGCSGTIILEEHYMWLMRQADNSLFTLKNLTGKHKSPLLLLLLSPQFIGDMADFLKIPTIFSHLFHATPLLKGDAISRLCVALVENLDDDDECEMLFLEIVGQVLHLLRLRHQALLRLSRHKQLTIEDLLPRLLVARQFIEAQYQNPIKTQDVATYISLSEYHFSRLFKAVFDMTVHQYIVQLRLNEARYLLETAQMTITDIALSVGYTSLSTFIHTFHRHFHVSPSHYQAKTRK